jgi:hypothetical protein
MAETLAEIGGDGEIRTRGKVCTLRRFSKPLVSATHPRLQHWSSLWLSRAIAGSDELINHPLHTGVSGAPA